MIRNFTFCFTILSFGCLCGSNEALVNALANLLEVVLCYSQSSIVDLHRMWFWLVAILSALGHLANQDKLLARGTAAHIHTCRYK